MDTWNAEVIRGGKSQRREEKKNEEPDAGRGKKM